MRHFAFCRPDGVVQYTSSLPDDVEPHVETGVTLVEINAPLPAGTHRYLNGSIEPHQIVPSLQEAVDARWSAIKAERNTRIAIPKPTSAGLFDADEASQNNLNKVIALVQIAASLGAPAEANYTLATNDRVTLTLAQLSMAALEMGAQVQAIYDTGDELRTAIEAATTLAQLDSIQWPAT